MLSNNEIKSILNKTVGCYILIKGKWVEYHPTFGQFLTKLDSEAHQLYKCYADTTLTKSQRQAIRGSWKGFTIKPMNSALVLLQQLIQQGASFDRFDDQYLRWLYKYIKKSSGIYDIPADAALYKVEGYRQKQDELDDNQLIAAALYQILCSTLSDASSLSLGAHMDNKDVFKTSDTRHTTFRDWVVFFTGLPGYSTWKEELLSRTDKKMSTCLRTGAPRDGLYYITDMYFG